MHVDTASKASTAPKTTIDGFRHRIDYSIAHPTRLTRPAFEALTDAEQTAYDDARLRWIGSGLWIKTPDTMNLIRSVRSHLRTSDALTVGESGLVLTGPAHIGKTTALWRVASMVEAQAAKTDPNYRGRGCIPVVYIEVPPKASPKSMAAQIIDFFGTPYNFRTSTQHEITTQAINLLRAHSTKVLIIDELQMLQLHGASGDAAIDTLKTLMNATGALLVFAGIDLQARLSSRAAEQILARCEVQTLNPFSAGSPQARGQWASLVQTFGAEMMLLDAADDHLAPWADRLMAVSGGRIGGLRRTLARALAAAIDEREDDEPEVITAEMLFGFEGFGVGAAT